ncbi:MAG: TonB-dependent receptor domain-containing protein, partial [bacterium]
VVYVDGVRIDTRATEWTGATGIKGLACCSFAGGTSTDRLNDLNPDDIERVEVLKGAAAATLYGSEASNGVIQIFTKHGKGESRPAWNFGVTGGFDKNRTNLPTKLFPNFTGPADSTGFRQRARDANDLIESGPYQGYELSVQGGGVRSNYYASGGLVNEQGSIQPNWDKRGNLRLNLAFLPTDRWTIEARSAYAHNHVAELQAGNNWTALLGNALNGDPRKATKLRPYGEAWVPVADIKRMDTFSNADRWTGGITASYAMRENFTHKITAGIDQVAEEKGRFFPFTGDYGSAGVTLGQKDLGYRDYTNLTIEYLGTLNIRPFHGIGSDISFGAQGLKEQERLNMAVGNQFAGPGVSTVTAASTTTGAEGFSERVNVGFHLQDRFSFGDRLFATIGLRVDGNSAFGENYGFKKFPKADISWIASQYAFIPKWISSLKLRGAIGQAGKAPGAFDKFTTFSARSVFAGTPGVVPENPGNVDLRPETSTELESGIESGFFNDRLGIETSIYWQFTKDAIVGVPNPPSLGFGASRKVNIGRLDNHGWDASFNYLAVSSRKFDWTTSLRFDGNNNKVISLGGVQLAGNAVREGYPVQGVWARPATGYSVVAGKPVTTRGDTAVYFGPPFATLNSSIGNTFHFGPFQAYALFTISRGASFGNGDRPYR